MAIDRFSSKKPAKVVRDPRVAEFSGEEADEIFTALSSKIPREIMARLYDEPMTMSDLADSLDESLQNIDYHMQKLIGADLVEVVDTVDSEKRKEMKVYAPADSSIAFVGSKSQVEYVKERLRAVLGIVLVVTAFTTTLYVAWQHWLRGVFEHRTDQLVGADPDVPIGEPLETVILDPIVLFLVGIFVVLFLLRIVLHWRIKRRSGPRDPQ